MELNDVCPDQESNPLCGLRVAQLAFSTGEALLLRGNRVLAFDVPLEDGTRFRDALEDGGDPFPDTAYDTRLTTLGCISCGHCIVSSMERNKPVARRSVDVRRADTEA